MKYYKKVLASFLVILMLSSVFSTGATATDMLGVVSAVDNIETHEDHSAITGQALDAAITAAEEEMSKDEFFEYFSSLPGTTTENEYDAFLAEQSQAITRIRNGEAQAGDEELAAFDYREYYYDLKELSESELSYLGYDQNRINIIKNFQGSDAEIRRASADVSGTVLIIHSQINDNSSSKSELKMSCCLLSNIACPAAKSGSTQVSITGFVIIPVHTSDTILCSKGRLAVATKIKSQEFNSTA